MNIALWIAQILLAIAFGFHAYTLLHRLDRTRKRVPWMRAASNGLLQTIGTLETLAAVGLVLPAATGVLASLTPIAAASLVALMLLAIVFHIRRREWRNVVLNLILGALSAFVLYGRMVSEPI